MCYSAMVRSPSTNISSLVDETLPSFYTLSRVSWSKVWCTHVVLLLPACFVLVSPTQFGYQSSVLVVFYFGGLWLGGHMR